MNVLYRWCSKLILAVALFTALPRFASAQDIGATLDRYEAWFGHWEDQVYSQMPQELDPASINDFESYEGSRPKVLEVGNELSYIEYEVGQIGADLDIIESVETNNLTFEDRVRIDDLRYRGGALSFSLPGIASTLLEFTNYLDAIDIIWDAWQGQSVDVIILKAEAGESVNAAMSFASDFSIMVSGTEGCQRAAVILTWYYNGDGNNAIGLMYAHQTIASGNRDDAVQLIFNSGSLSWMVQASLGNPFWDEWENWLYAVDNDINYVTGSVEWACYYYQNYC